MLEPIPPAPVGAEPYLVDMMETITKEKMAMAVAQFIKQVTFQKYKDKQGKEWLKLEFSILTPMQINKLSMPVLVMETRE